MSTPDPSIVRKAAAEFQTKRPVRFEILQPWKDVIEELRSKRASCFTIAKDKQIPYVAIDSDNENSTLKRFHPDAEFIDLAEPRDLDGMFSALERSPLALVDCRAASTDVFFDYFQEIDVAETLRALDAELTVIMPVNHESDSLEQVQSVVKQFADLCRYVVLRNAVHIDSFALYDKSKVRQRLNAELGAKEISMERLRPWLVEGLQRANLTIAHASRHADFPLLDRQRLQTWQRHLYREIDSVADLLLPAAQSVPAVSHEKDRLLWRFQPNG